MHGRIKAGGAWSRTFLPISFAGNRSAARFSRVFAPDRGGGRESDAGPDAELLRMHESNADRALAFRCTLCKWAGFARLRSNAALATPAPGRLESDGFGRLGRRRDLFRGACRLLAAAELYAGKVAIAPF